MHNQMRGPNDNPYKDAIQYVSVTLSVIATFFLFPFVFRTVDGVLAFANVHYGYLPDWLIWFLWGLVILIAMLAGGTLLFIHAINLALTLSGRMRG